MIDIRANEYWGFVPLKFKRPDFEGYVYILYARRNRLFKIGMTRRDPEKRLKDLQTGMPDQLVFVFLIQAKYPEALENELHIQFADKRLNGEWFSLSKSELQLIYYERIVHGFEPGTPLPYFNNDGTAKNDPFPYSQRYSSVFDALDMTDADIMEMHAKYGTSKFADIRARYEALHGQDD